MSNAELSPGHVRKIALEEHFVTPELAKYGACTSTVAQHETGADGSFEARSVVTGPGARISAGREQSSAETRGFLDARVWGVDLRWKS